MSEIYSAEPRKWRILIATTVLIAGSLALCWLAVDIYLTFGTHPADGYQGELAPWRDRALFSAILIVIALAILTCTWLYLAAYIRKMVEHEDGAIEFHFFVPGTLQVSQEDIYKTRHFDGEYNSASAPSVRAPFTLVYVHQRKLPLIFDPQGQVLQPKVLRRYIS